MNNSEVTVVLSGYRRPEALQEQYEAVQNQTIKNIPIMLCINYDQENYPKFSMDIINKCIASINTRNLGVWSRFAFALNARTKYVCVMDDDTIPGDMWIENCLNTIKEYDGLLGCRGIKMLDDTHVNYPSCKYECVARNEEVEEVDIIGHSWFFKKDWLKAYWALMPDYIPFMGGEDMHFSFAMQKILNLKSYVPKQPPDNQRLWGSLNPSKYGEDMNATSRTKNGTIDANSYWNYMIKNGYTLVKDKT